MTDFDAESGLGPKPLNPFPPHPPPQGPAYSVSLGTSMPMPADDNAARLAYPFFAGGELDD
jgi:hypothetical protein